MRLTLLPDGHTESLRRTDCNIATKLSRGLEHGQRHQVRRRHYQRVRLLPQYGGVCITGYGDIETADGEGTAWGVVAFGIYSLESKHHVRTKKRWKMLESHKIKCNIVFAQKRQTGLQLNQHLCIVCYCWDERLQQELKKKLHLEFFQLICGRMRGIC